MAILRPEEQLRVHALGYFVEAHSEDASLMPLVIKAVEQYGREDAFHLLRRADHLSQTAETIDWLIGELGRDFDTQDLVWDNYCFAVALILLNAEPALLIDRQDEIFAARCFPNRLAPLLEQRLKLHTMNWRSLWGKLVEFCEQYPDIDQMPLVAVRRGNEFVDALARRLTAHPEERAEFDSEHVSPQGDIEATITAFEARLAGSIRDEKRAAWLIRSLHNAPTLACDEVIGALVRIGTDEIVQRLVEAYPDADVQFQSYVPGVLAHIHSDFAADACMNLFEQAYDMETAANLAHACLDQFDDRAISPVHELVHDMMDEEIDVEVADLFHVLVMTSMFTGVEFPGFDEWKEVSEKANWGAVEHQSIRISDGFFDETKTLQSVIIEIAKQGGWQSAEEIDDEYDEFEDEVVEQSPSARTITREAPRVGRNDPCPCGSGKKYKKCCLHRTNGGRSSVR
ncbi:MAG: SEC-C metal-binding domain-containing protein [Pirellulaceae bacterium]